MAVLLKGLILWVLGNAVAKLLLGAGLAIYFHTWISDSVNQFLSFLMSSLLNVPGYELLLIAGVGEVLSIIGGAVVARAFLVSSKMMIGRG